MTLNCLHSSFCFKMRFKVVQTKGEMSLSTFDNQGEFFFNKLLHKCLNTFNKLWQVYNECLVKNSSKSGNFNFFLLFFQNIASFWFFFLLFFNFTSAYIGVLKYFAKNWIINWSFFDENWVLTFFSLKFLYSRFQKFKHMSIEYVNKKTHFVF